MFETVGFCAARFGKFIFAEDCVIGRSKQCHPNKPSGRRDNLVIWKQRSRLPQPPIWIRRIATGIPISCMPCG